MVPVPKAKKVFTDRRTDTLSLFFLFFRIRSVRFFVKDFAIRSATRPKDLEPFLARDLEPVALGRPLTLLA
jgi:hypothetical protein